MSGSEGRRVCVCGWGGVILAFVWLRVECGHRVVIQLLCRKDTPSLGSVVLLQHPSRHYITQLESIHHPTNVCIHTAHTHAHSDTCTLQTSLYTPHKCLHTHLTNARIHHTHFLHSNHNHLIIHTLLMTAQMCTNDCRHTKYITHACKQLTPGYTPLHQLYTLLYTHVSLHTLHQ